jgi:outer membrane protein assembly factor BamB
VRTSNLTFNPTAGTTYRIAVDGWGRNAGTVKLNWNGCQAPTPTPTATPSPTPTATPTATPVVSPFPTPTPVPPGQAVAYQIDPAHTGAQSDNLSPPLTQRWTRDLGGFVSYPLIAGGRVFVTVAPAKLFALDEATGANVWGPIDLGGSGPWSGIAYDGGRVFAVNYSGLLRAFDAASGAVVWSRQLPQSFFSSPPTAFGGLVYTAGSGGNGTLSAVSQQDGTIKWTASVFTAEHSSPAVSGTDVYVSYSCNLAYDFSPPTGTLLWRHTTSCFGGGGKTPVLFGNRLYVRDSSLPNAVLNASNGAELGTFSASVAPAFSGSTGYFRTASTLQARDVASNAVLWSFTGDGTLSSAPIIDNGYVYIGSTSGKLYALSASTGANVWTGILGASVSAPDEQNVSLPTTGLGAGDGLVVVPATNLLVAYQAAPPNPIDQADFFVKQHYLDFLNRQPDPSGLTFWTNEITSCGSDQTCIDAKRVNVSAAYFLSIEFQQTGYLVERIYKSAYGDAIGNSTFGGLHTLPIPIIRLNEFLPDTQKIGLGVIVGQAGWEQALENNKVAFTSEFVQRSRFTSAYPTSLTPTQFVDRLFGNAGVLPSSSDRSAAINEFGVALDTTDNAARARALRRVAENATLLTNESNRAFVLMQYFGYLRRNPNDPSDTDYTGYNFWLTKLNQFNGNFVNAEMVKAFIVSGEYRGRFGP